MWFVGDHGMVGGSGKLQPLTAATLAWIADGAVTAGLDLKSDVAAPQVAPDSTVSGNIYSNEDFDPKNPGRLAEPREGPSTLSKSPPASMRGSPRMMIIAQKA